jgi:iron complex outermembrane recepter protein
MLIANGPRMVCLMLVFASASPASAQSGLPPDETIVVIGARPTFDVAPERSLNEADVESYGLSSVGEVLDEIAAENGDRREDHVFLVNGKRINGLGSVEGLPAEAITKVEVLPVGSGVEVGASSRQRVYNIVLRSELDLVALRAGVRLATQGSWSSRRADLSHTKINGERRLSLAAKVRDDDMLLESERDVVQPAGSVAGAGQFRSLFPGSTRLDVNLSVADQLAPWLNGSLTGKFTASRQRSLLGAFPPEEFALRAYEQNGRSVSFDIDAALNAAVGSWQLTTLGNYSYNRRRTLTDRLDPSEQDLAIATTVARSETVNGLLMASGPLAQLPAGPLRLTANAGFTRDTIRGDRRFLNFDAGSSISQTTATIGGRLEVPIASTKQGFLRFIGDLTASAEFIRTQVSDFGSFSARTFGLTWRPANWIRVHGSISRGENAPSVSLLNDPLLETPGVLYFDPVANETVLVTRITGGIGELLPQTTRTTRVGMNIKPIRAVALQLTAEYLSTSNRNVASSLPPASASVIAIFPDRFIRDPAGRLIAVDTRPVVFASRDERQLRLGFNLNLPIGEPRRSAGPGGARNDGDTADEETRRGGARPRLQLNASHTWLLRSQVVITPGGSLIDLLAPTAIGFGGLGQPRHRFDLSLGYAEGGLGARLIAQHRTSSFIEASGATANVLRFAPLTTLNLRAWIQGSRIFPAAGWAKGTRVSLTVQNLTNQRERVEDRFGATPLAYQPAFRDPIGRSVEIELRKRF